MENPETMDMFLRCRGRDHGERPLLGGIITVGVVALLLLLAAPVAAAPPLGDLTIPANRVPNWYLPTLVDTSGWTVTPVHAVNCADNTTEDATVIRNAISAASANTILQLDASCTYNIQSGGGIAMSKSNLLLRGGGMNSTIIHWGVSSDNGCYMGSPNMFGTGMGTGSGFLNFCGTTGTGAAINWNAGYTKGATSITVADDSTLSVGDWLGLVSEFPAELEFGNTSSSANGGRHIELLKIAVKRPGGQANVLTLDRPLRNDNTDATVEHQVVYKWNPVQNSGVESLTIRPYDATSDSKLLAFSNAAYVWATDVRIDGANSIHMNFTRAARSVVNRGYFNDLKFTPFDESSISFGALAVDNVVMNSIFIRNAVDVKFESACSGNLWIYNYQRRFSTPRKCDGTGGTGPWAERAIFLHGMANESLIEGNDTECQFGVDNWWGTQQYRNTAYRNRQGVVTMGGSTAEGWGFGNEINNSGPLAFSMNYIMNTVTRFYRVNAGVGSTFDAVGNPTGTYNLWLERNLIKGALNLVPRSDTTSVNNVASSNGPVSWSGFSAPASLVYAAKPTWWTIASPWPGIGADVDTIGGTMHKLPAQCRYEGSTTGDCAGSVAPLGSPGRPFLMP